MKEYAILVDSDECGIESQLNDKAKQGFVLIDIKMMPGQISTGYMAIMEKDVPEPGPNAAAGPVGGTY